MRLFGFDITRARPSNAAPVSGQRGWLSIVREPYTGAWQRNDELAADNVVSYGPVFACVTLIAADIGKLGLRLVAVDDNDIWTPTESAAFSPVLRKPNRYQTRIKFVEYWLTSKLIHGNAYILKQRDIRGVVVALYVLDPTRVTPLVTPSGDVYYQLKRDDLSGVPDGNVVVPAREIIHDPMVCLFHPLIGVTPITACGLAALQGLQIQSSSERFFANGSHPGGVLSAPGEIGDETAARLKEYFDSNFSGDNAGKVAVLGDGLKYEGMAVNATDAQLIDQLGWTGKNVAACYHVPPYKIGAGEPPHFNTADALTQDYYSQCLQELIESFELCLDEGLELPKPYGTEFNLDDLIRMDNATRTKVAADSIGSGAMAPNEARSRYFNLGPVEGGATPYLQVQNYSLAALAQRDAADPFAKPPKPEPPPLPPEPPPDEGADPDFVPRLFWEINRKAIEVGLYAS